MMKKCLLILWFFSLGLLGTTQELIPEAYGRSRYSNMNDVFNISDLLKRSEVQIPFSSLDTSISADNSDTINAYIAKYANDTFEFSSGFNERIRVAKIILPKGRFCIKNPIYLRSNVRLYGQSAEETQLICNVGEGRHCIIASPSNEGKSIQPIISGKIVKDVQSNHSLKFDFPTNRVKDDKLYLGGLQIKNDSNLVTSTWAKGSVQELFTFTNNTQDSFYNLENFGIRYHLPQLFWDQFVPNLNFYKLDTTIAVHLYEYIYNTGVHCLSIKRQDTTNSQTSNILFQNAVYCHVRGVQSEGCNFAHITLNRSAGCVIKRNHIYNGNGYGGGGKAYGIVLQQSSSQNTLADNTLHHLRHSILLQSGANKNAIIANYSYDPFWEQSGFPTDAAGDLVLHGNYPFGNVFEFNVAQQIVIDDSHGKNGPHNIFHRNLLQGYGIFMSAANGSDSQVFTGNDVTNTGIFKGQYILQDQGHFQFGNRVKGTVRPSNTVSSLQNSVCYYQRYRHEDDPVRTGFSWSPITFINVDSIPFGEPFNQTWGIPAWKNPLSFPTCSEPSDFYGTRIYSLKNEKQLWLYPNPSKGEVTIKESGVLKIYNNLGQLLEIVNVQNQKLSIKHKGLLILSLTKEDGETLSARLIAN